MTKHPAKRIRQNIHRLYHERLKREIEFKRAVKAPPINIEILTKENRNDPTIKRNNAAEPKRG